MDVGNNYFGQFLHSRIRQSEKAIFDWRPNRASYTVEKELFRLSDSTRTSGRQQSRRFDWMLRSNCPVEKVYEPIASLTPPQKHKHAHTSIPVPPINSCILQRRRRWLGCYHCYCFSPQVSVALSWSSLPASCIGQ